jgi:TonB family protein
VVGFLQQHIVTPDDFTRRYSSAEQKLILAHEEVHLERQDARINALAALARCVCWFNPLVHLGAHAMRIDQELSCDAAVIEQRPKARRAYAETLLKTQLASRPLPVGCYWPAPINANGAVHPLTERIDMLTRKPLSQRRRIAATVAILSLACAAGATAWAAQPERKIQSTIATPPIVAGDAPEVLLQLQPIAPHGHAPSRTDIRLTPDEPAPPESATTSPRVRPGGTVPEYPSESRALKEHGSVLLELCVDAEGKVETAKLLKSSGYPNLDTATMTWLKNEQLNPAMREGKPVRLCGYQLQYDWMLKDDAPTPTPG